MAMDGDQDDEKGLLGAHAPGISGGAVAAGAPGAAEDEDLLDGSPDLEDGDMLALAADTVAGPRRARGRPKGAANRRNMDMVAYLGALGHRDPLVTLSMIQTADAKVLAKRLGVDTAKGRMAVMELQRKAAADMLPYVYAKKPQQLDLPSGERLAAIIIGEATINQRIESAVIGLGTLPEARPEKANEINGHAVRLAPDESHDGE